MSRFFADHHSHHGYQPGNLPFSRCLRRCSTAVAGRRTDRQADQAISIDLVYPPLGEHARVVTPVRKGGPVCRRCGGWERDVLVDEGLEATAGGGALAAPPAKGQAATSLTTQAWSAVAELPTDLRGRICYAGLVQARTW